MRKSSWGHSRFSALLYQALFGFAFLGGTPGIPVAAKYPGRIRDGFFHYLGNLPKIGSKPLVWVHGVSLGESLAAGALMKCIREAFPGLTLGFTTTHPDVLENARRKRLADVFAYFPLDFVPFLKRAFNRWRPRAVILVETDFWPGFSLECRRRRIPLLLVNGRISEKMFRFYSLWPSLGEAVFGSFSGLAVQTAADFRRLECLGAQPGRISVLGNLKTDLTPETLPPPRDELRQWVGNNRLIVFGSLHPPEFEQLAPFFPQLLKLGCVRILIAPRNIGNIPIWERALKDAGINASRRSTLVSQAPSPEAVLLDTYGELAGLYGLARAAFIGGTLDPQVGGHNPLEALNFGVPTVMGPHVRNFEEISRELRDAGGLILASDAEQASIVLQNLLRNDGRAAKMSLNAEKALNHHRGALSRTLFFLRPFLEKISIGGNGKF